MALNYARRLENIRDRKFDRELRESIFEKSAQARLLPQNVKYLVEAMLPIEDKYNQRTLEAATKVQNHLEQLMNLSIRRAYRTQGSVRTNTNIKVHSDFDLLAIIDSYVFYEKSTTGGGSGGGTNYTPVDSDYNKEIQDLRKEAVRVMRKTYDDVDDSGPKSISIFNKNLNRKVDIVFCFWWESLKYQETKNSYYHGVHLYDFPRSQKISPADYPFATIQNVNTKGDSTRDGSRRGIRLLKTLRADSEVEFKKLKSFQLTSIVHGMQDPDLHYTPGAELILAKDISRRLSVLINDAQERKAVTSPNGAERPLENDDTVPELKRLKGDLDELITDSERDVANTMIKSAMARYQV